MKPTKATIRSFQVGFGDCFLLTFNYATEDRHVLIDCGSMAPPNGHRGTFSMVSVANLIKDATGGKLHAVVATHRHKDHISGFSTAKNKKGAGDIIRSLKPDLVVQPWTEDPKLPEDARKPRAARHDSGKVALGLQGMSTFSEGLLGELRGLTPVLGVNLVKRLSFLGEDNVANPSAVKNLMTMGKKKEYLCYGMKSGLEKLLPGVKVHVLGPPTPEQYPDVVRQKSKDAAEFWHLRGATADTFTARTASPFAPAHRVADPAFPPDVRWIIPRIQASRGAQLMELVTILDKALNNTSLILLFEFGNKKLLFPGDAQLENWEHALKYSSKAAQNRALLAGTDLYKVGHHGSLNATPKTLWALFKKKGTGKGKLSTMMSTTSGKHGSTANRTEVPRTKLVEQLELGSRLTNTETFAKEKVRFKDVVIDA